ncbi:Zinc finger MYM-type protein 1, partial [Trachymyrmex cornetzi]
LWKLLLWVLLFGQFGLSLRGNDSDDDSCFKKFLKLRAKDVPELHWWLEKTGYKWLHHDIINELLQMLSTDVLNRFLYDIKAARYFSVIMDETADISRQEQVSISLRITTTDLETEEIFMGFYHTPNTKSETLFNILKDVFTRFHLPISNLRGQCYDGAAAMSGKSSRLQTRVKNVAPKALFVHCTAHSLNLVVQDSIDCKFIIGISKDLITYIRDSPKRVEAFKQIQQELQSWCMRVKSLKTIFANYEAIVMFLDECKTEKTCDSGKAEGLLKFLEEFEFYFLLALSIKILERVEILNCELRKKDLSINESHDIVKIMKDGISTMRDSGFDSLWEVAVKKAKKLDLNDPKLPRHRRALKRLKTANAHVFKDPESYYKKIYLETVDQLLFSLNERFQSETMDFLNNCENFIIGNVADLASIVEFYDDDLDIDRLELHRDMFIDMIKAKDLKVTNLKDAVNVLKNDIAMVDCVSELVSLAKLVLTIPSSTCTAERSFSALRRLKTYLNSTMLQQRMNSIAILHVHREIAEKIDIDKLLNDFISKNKNRRSTFSMLNE